ncbi:RhoGAP-domain-containing protein [Hesseltinella vesiculosa]|uniref:RhoGAP-domain-containing protein n=1 Tax=Hesseltinella vesiculosa TaxID=101127 RepID=A0A1X2G351_9FUNG|nr:RhoGAP-domain-containing protein [Hesseltinella vesiculosa]
MLSSIDEISTTSSIKSASLRSSRRCPSCQQPCSRRDRTLIRALGNIYHYQCFTCADCQALVANKFYALEQEGQFKIVCEKHYHARLQPCANCQERPCRCDYRRCPGCRSHPPAEKGDLYLEYDGQAYCLFHFAAIEATHCLGCDQAILKQFVEHKSWPNKKWHPECYMIFKFWNVRLRDTSQVHEPAKTSQQVQKQLQEVESKVSRIWTDLSTFEESSATCISEMLLLVASSAYMDAFRMASQFIMHLQVLFAALEAIHYQHDSEARTVCHHVIRFFRLLAQQDGGPIDMTQELVSLVTHLAQSLKILIRLGLTEALQQECHGKDKDATDKFLKSILELEKKRVWIGGRYWFKDDAFHNFLATMSCPLLSQCNEDEDDHCTGCHQAMTTDAYQVGYERWHSKCFVCNQCNTSLISQQQVLYATTSGLVCNTCHPDSAVASQPMIHLTPLQHEFYLVKLALLRFYHQTSPPPTGQTGTNKATALAAGIVNVKGPPAKHLPVLEQGSPQPTKKTNNVTLISPRWLRVTNVPSSPPHSHPHYLGGVAPLPLRPPSSASLFGSIDLGNIKRSRSTRQDRLNVQPASLPRRAHTIHQPSSPAMTGHSHLQKQLPPLPANLATSCPSSPAPSQPPLLTIHTPASSLPPSPSPLPLSPPTSPAKRTMSSLRRAWSLRRNNSTQRRQRTSIYSLFDTPVSYAPTSPTSTLPETSTITHPPPSAIDPFAMRHTTPTSSKAPTLASPTPPPTCLLHTSAAQYHLIRHLAALSIQSLVDDPSLDDLFGLISVRKSTIWTKLKQLRRKPLAQPTTSPAAGKCFGVPLGLLASYDDYLLTSSAETPTRNQPAMEALKLACTSPHCLAPGFLRQILIALMRKDLTVEGIFRKNGNIRELKQLEATIDAKQATDRTRANYMTLLEQQNPIQLAALLKRFLRELPEPLLPDRFYPLLLTAMRKEADQDKQTLFHLISCMMPKENRDAMELLFGFLHHVASCEGNRMDTYNLARVFTPNILYTTANDRQAPENEIMVIDYLIRHQDMIAKIPPEFVSILSHPGLVDSFASLDGKQVMKHYTHWSQHDWHLRPSSMASPLPPQLSAPTLTMPYPSPVPSHPLVASQPTTPVMTGAKFALPIPKPSLTTTTTTANKQRRSWMLRR